MNTTNRLLLTSIFIVSMSAMVNGQLAVDTPGIVVGKAMPDFTLHNIAYYPAKQAALKDFRGKWLMLEFWDKGCGACISGFPNTNKIQQALGDHLQVMLVAKPDHGGTVQPMYARLKEKEGLTMPCAFDSLVWDQFVEEGVPNVILIDDKGIVRCWTIDLLLSEIKTFMSGGSLNLKQPGDDLKYRNKRIAYTPELPLLVNDNGVKAGDFLFRSVLTPWDRNGNNRWDVDKIDSNLAATGKLEVLGISLGWLYQMAYWGVVGRIRPDDPERYGKFYNKMVIETKDSALFDDMISGRYNRNMYCYSLIMPKEKSSIAVMQQTMQEDLRRYFGYQVVAEQRNCPCWILKAAPNAMKILKTPKNIADRNSIAKGGILSNNIPFESIVQYLREGVLFRDYVEDETGITGNVNFMMDVTANIEQTKKALRENGLELVRGEKEMTVFIVRDSKRIN